MPRPDFPIRIKVLLTVLVLVMLVIGLNTSSMANLFRKDKTTYIRDLTSVMAVHLAEEVGALLKNYAANVRVFADVVYDEQIDPVTKRQVLQGLFRNYEDIVAIAVQRDDAEPVTAFDTGALARLGIDRTELSALRAGEVSGAVSTGAFDIRAEHIKAGTTLLIMTVGIPPTAKRGALTLTAGIDPARLTAATKRSRGFEAEILDQDGRAVLEDEVSAEQEPPVWIEQIERTSGAISGGTVEFTRDGVSMIGAYAPFAGGALLATVQIPTSVVYLTTRELLSNLTAGALILFVCAAVAGLFFARRLTRPLETLTAAARQVGRGEFAVSVKTNSRDEIGALSSSFNRMTEELQEREVKLEEANAALIQSEKLAAFGQLGAGIAHEVKNPLAGILGHTQLTLRKLEEDSPLRKNLGIIEKETRRCTEIISNLLKFARQDGATMQSVDLNDVIDASLAIVDHQLRVNNVAITRELAADLPTIHGNANQLQQMLMNFAINAQQAMGEEGGTLTIRSRRGDDGSVIVEVEDDGPGIPDEIKNKVFEPFFTTKPAGQGTGLGLSVTYGIVRDHGGNIRILDVPAGGTRFEVRLPAGKAPS